MFCQLENNRLPRIVNLGGISVLRNLQLDKIHPSWSLMTTRKGHVHREWGFCVGWGTFLEVEETGHPREETPETWWPLSWQQQVGGLRGITVAAGLTLCPPEHPVLNHGAALPGHQCSEQGQVLASCASLTVRPSACITLLPTWAWH